jgi:hypothetical protein
MKIDRPIPPRELQIQLDAVVARIGGASRFGQKRNAAVIKVRTLTRCVHTHGASEKISSIVVPNSRAIFKSDVKSPCHKAEDLLLTVT